MRTIYLLSLAISLYACEVEEEKVYKTGPEGSWWVGGADGGVYILIHDDKNSEDKIYYGKIFYDSDKTVWYEGPLELIGDLDFSVENREQYLGWDGESLHLIESSYLKATNPIPPL